MSRVVLAADVGGTSIKLGVVRDGSMVARERITVTDRRRLEPWLEPMRQAWMRMLRQTGLPADALEGIGLAFPGIVDPRANHVRSTNDKYTDAPGLDLAAWSMRAFDAPLHLDNDARAACIGEWTFGAGRGIDDLVMVTLGTGIGSSAIIEGRPLVGGHGQAGVLGGHLTVDLHGRLCSCGNVGCAEAEASTDRLDAIAAEHETTTPQPSVSTAASPWDYQRVFSLAANGDTLARKLRDAAVQVWSSAVVNLVHAYDPSVVVIGGGIGSADNGLIPALQASVDARAWTPWGKVQLRASQLGDDAALLGMAARASRPSP